MEERLDDAINVLRNHAESVHALAQSGLITHSSVNGLLASYQHGRFCPTQSYDSFLKIKIF